MAVDSRKKQELFWQYHSELHWWPRRSDPKLAPR